jgi:hypothetical protein
LLLSLVFWVCYNPLRVTVLVFHLLEFVNLPYPLEKDPVVSLKSSLDYKDVSHLVLDDDLALFTTSSLRKYVYPHPRPGQGASAT